MAKSLGVLTPQEFFAGFGIGDEIKETNNFLKRLFLKFIKMLRFFYKTIKKHVFNDIIKLWPIYLSLFLVAIVFSFFTQKVEANFRFIVYFATIVVTFFMFVFTFVLFELWIKLIIKLVLEIKALVKNFMKKKYVNAFGNLMWCIILFIFICVVGVGVVFMCLAIKYFINIINGMFNRILSMGSRENEP